MSKNILFRGQTRKKGEKVTMSGTPIPSNWVFGGIFPQNNGGDFAIIYQQDPEIQKFPVYAETVCQYTGKDELVVDYLANPTGWAERTMKRIEKASLKFWITLAMTEELTEEYVKKYSNPDTPEGKFKSLADSIKNYKNVRLGLDVNGEIDSVKYPVDGIFNMDAMYDGYLDTWNIATRSEEERIEEFLEENDALLKNRDKIPFKYISDIHYGKKTVWKNPDFEN